MGFSKVQNPASISFKHGFKTRFDLTDQLKSYLGTLILYFAWTDRVYNILIHD
jgi:hypothetical protein